MQTQILSFSSQYGQQYAITLEFQLQREKEKNKILEQRLRNKQIFIVEMKKMQSQLELISEKCREQLLEQKEKREVLEKTTLRECMETISELEHKIRYLQNIPGVANLSKFCQQLSRNKSAPKYHYETAREKMKESTSHSNLLKKNINTALEKNQTNELFKNFVNRFLQMFSIYHQVNKELSMKKNLKVAWKWIKQVVKQWEYNSSTLKQIFDYCERCQKQDKQYQPEHILRFRRYKAQAQNQEQA